MSNLEPESDEIYVAEEVADSSSEAYNPFDSPSTETSEGSTRPREETWSLTMFVAVAFGTLVAAVCGAGSTYFFTQIPDEPSFSAMLPMLVCILISIGLGAFAGTMMARRGKKKF
jgi:sorbitol-specific phosphotransferase system component IIBC